MLMMVLMISTVHAQDITEELDISTGIMWGFSGYVVTFEISDPDIAEVVKKNGNTLVHFLSPGDVFVTAIFYSGGQPVESYLYLFHVTGEPTGGNAVNRSSFAQEVLDIVNAERAKYNLRPLRLADDLNRYADIRAKEIVRLFSHTRPNGESALNIIPRCRYKGENIAAGTPSPQSVMEQWMNSPGHRANILSADFEELGVGYYFDDEGQYRHYWVQLFRAQ